MCVSKRNSFLDREKSFSNSIFYNKIGLEAKQFKSDYYKIIAELEDKWGRTLSSYDEWYSEIQRYWLGSFCNKTVDLEFKECPIYIGQDKIDRSFFKHPDNQVEGWKFDFTKNGVMPHFRWIPTACDTIITLNLYQFKDFNLWIHAVEINSGAIKKEAQVRTV